MTEYDPRDHVPTGGRVGAAWAVFLMLAALGLAGPTALCKTVEAAHHGLTLVAQHGWLGAPHPG